MSKLDMSRATENRCYVAKIPDNINKFPITKSLRKKYGF